jgi:flavin-binding protein dodecin
MSNHVYQILQLTGSSTVSSDDAIQQAIAKAAQTSKHVRWFEVVETRGQVQDGRVAHWQVTIKVGQTLD